MISERQIANILNHPELSDEQKAILERYDKENVVNGLSMSARLNYLKTLKKLGVHVKRPFEDVTKDDLIDFFF